MFAFGDEILNIMAIFKRFCARADKIWTRAPANPSGFRTKVALLAKFLLGQKRAESEIDRPGIKRHYRGSSGQVLCGRPAHLERYGLCRLNDEVRIEVDATLHLSKLNSSLFFKKLTEFDCSEGDEL